jgi:tetratricopeptide (TPR) repeat protein
MAILSTLFNSIIAAAKRHIVSSGIVGTAAAAAVTTHLTKLSTPVETYLSDNVSPYYCEYRQHGQKPVSDESQFNILVSRLVGDPWLTRRDSVMRAFQNENGFHVTPICDLFTLDYSMESQARTNDLRKRAMPVINSRNADLLLFGEVTDQDTVVIYAVNDHGYCDLRPKGTEIKHGLLQGEITKEEKANLIKASLEEIESACLYQHSYDWPAFAKRINKMEMFLTDFDFHQAQDIELASAYVDATRLLYENGHDGRWFSSGDEFTKRVIQKYKDKDKANIKELSSLYNSYANLLTKIISETRDNDILNSALGALGKAINLDPGNAFAYINRAYAYKSNGDWDRAFADYGKAIELDAKDASFYNYRGNAYLDRGDRDRAIADYSKEICCRL